MVKNMLKILNIYGFLKVSWKYIILLGFELFVYGSSVDV